MKSRGIMIANVGGASLFTLFFLLFTSLTRYVEFLSAGAEPFFLWVQKDMFYALELISVS